MKSVKTIFLDGCGILGFYPKRVNFRTSTRYAKKIFRGKRVIVAEIGVDEGRNALKILQNLNVEKIYLIDPYLDYKAYVESEPHRTKDGFSLAQRSARKRLEKYMHKIVWVKEFSGEAVNKIPRCDFIYVDGSHNYNFVKEDLELYFKKVKKGGIFAGHDIEHKDVFKAFSEFTVKNKLNAWVSYPDWIIKK